MGFSVFPAPAAAGAPFSRNVRLTSSGTWAHPDGYSSPRLIRVLAYGGGASGAAGCAVQGTSNATNQTYSAGMGGASGRVVYQDFVVSADTTYTIGAGGSAVAGVSSSGSIVNGTSGNSGGNTVFGTIIAEGGGGSTGGRGHNAQAYDYWFQGGDGGQVAPHMSRRTDWNRTSYTPNGIGEPAYIDNGYAKGASWRYYNNQNINVQMTGNQSGPVNSSNYSGGSMNFTSGPYTHWTLLAGAGWHSGQIAINGYTLPLVGFTATAAELAGTGRFPGGQCGANKSVASGTATADSGQTPASGYGGGGGGGGSMVIIGAGTATSGGGGAGKPGMIEIWY